jgi:hypothetical protein
MTHWSGRLRCYELKGFKDLVAVYECAVDASDVRSVVKVHHDEVVTDVHGIDELLKGRLVLDFANA